MKVVLLFKSKLSQPATGGEILILLPSYFFCNDRNNKSSYIWGVLTFCWFSHIHPTLPHFNLLPTLIYTLCRVYGTQSAYLSAYFSLCYLPSLFFCIFRILHTNITRCLSSLRIKKAVEILEFFLMNRP